MLATIIADKNKEMSVEIAKSTIDFEKMLEYPNEFLRYFLQYYHDSYDTNIILQNTKRFSEIVKQSIERDQERP